MKKIGILFGQENTFPQAFVERINEKKVSGIMAEPVQIDKVVQGEPTDYAVIIDRISQDVPFYRAYLKNAAIGGTAVLNNPFWWSADEKFFNNALAVNVGVAVPKTVLLPSHARPDDTNENSFRNLKFPFDWEGIFKYVGFPAYMKPHSGGGWKSVYRIERPDELFARHAETGQLVMMLQEEIKFTDYFRCYCLATDNVHIMQYEPRNPHHLRYVSDRGPAAKALLDKVRDGVIKLNKALGYDFNTVEFAVRDGVPYAIDFCNPAPDADVHSVGQANFDWIVENAANMAIERAKRHKDGQMNLTWGTFITRQMPAALAGEVKRGPGKSKGSTAAAKAPAETAEKRKPGRPRRTETALAAAPKVTKPKTDAPKGKRGRPRKTEVQATTADAKPATPTVVKPKGKPGPKPGAKAAARAAVNPVATKAPKAAAAKPVAAKPAAPKAAKAATPAKSAKVGKPAAPKATKPATPKAEKAVKAVKPAAPKAAKPAKAAEPAAPKATKPATPKAEKAVKAVKPAAPKAAKPAAPKAVKPAAPKTDAPKADAPKATPAPKAPIAKKADTKPSAPKTAASKKPAAPKSVKPAADTPAPAPAASAADAPQAPSPTPDLKPAE
jgi:glutathione synthase/RimK-type ligase-like ATP-grasp enzyme